MSEWRGTQSADRVKRQSDWRDTRLAALQAHKRGTQARLKPPDFREIQPKGHHAMAKNRKVIITCAVTGAIHTPVDVAAICRSRPTRSPTRRSARPRPARRSSTCMPATRRPAGPTSRPEAFAPFLQASSSARTA